MDSRHKSIKASSKSLHPIISYHDAGSQMSKSVCRGAAAAYEDIQNDKQTRYCNLPSPKISRESQSDEEQLEEATLGNAKGSFSERKMKK